MESDRGAVLTVRAAARGVIDFSRARVRDVRWWRRSNAIIRAMDRDDEFDLVRAAFDLQRSLVGNSGLTDESFKQAQKTANEAFAQLQQIRRPWFDKAKAKADAIAGMIAEYKKYIGDPDDPVFREKLLADAAAAEAASAPPAESEDARIERLIRERDAHEAARRRR